MPEGEGRWLPVEVADLSVDDRVRVTHRRRPQRVHEGVVARLVDELPGVRVLHPDSRPGGEYFHPSYRTFERWTPYVVESTEPEPEPEYTWVDVDASDLRPGDMARGLDDGRFGVDTPEAEVTEETVEEQDEYVYLRGSGGWDRGRRWQRRVPATEPVPAAPVEEPTGWVAVSDFSTLRMGDIVRATPNMIGGRMQARVTSVDPFGDGYTAFTTHVITPSNNGAQRDRVCFGSDGYAYGDPGHDTEVWRGAMPAPVPDAGPVAQREMAIPEWATSLDRARRYVHEQAIELWRNEQNCWDGTSDFLVSADLPEEEEWPEPDESAEIRAFLFKVRDAALSTAFGHGKSVHQVEEWLTFYGITAPAPPPVRRTITVEVPAEVTEEQFRSEVIAFAAGPERPARNWRVV